MRQINKPWMAIGMTRATWYRHGKPSTKPVRRTTASMAASIGVSVRTIYRAKRAHHDRRVQRWLTYLDIETRDLIKAHPRASNQQIVEMIEAHRDSLSEERLREIMGD